MKIILENFRCYIRKEIDLGTSGITLLSAPSGFGKTTIFEGIYFVISGVGTKIISQNKKTCQVILYFQDIIITRSKKPNKLTLDMNTKRYEDDEAQEIINKRFGHMFDKTSYLSQNSIKAFINLSPTDKIEFIEEFAFKEIDISKIKEQTRVSSMKKNDECISLYSKVELLKDQFDVITVPTIQKQMKYTLEEYLTQEKEIKLYTSKLLIQQKEEDTEIQQHELLNQYMLFENQRLDEYQIKKNNLKVVYPIDLTYKECIELKLSNINIYQIYINEKIELEKKIELLEKLKTNEISEINQELYELVPFQKYSKEHVIDTISTLQETIQDLVQFEKITNQIKLNQIDFLIKEQLELKLIDVNLALQSNNIRNFTCPHCQQLVSLKEDNLEKYETPPISIVCNLSGNKILEHKSNIIKQLKEYEKKEILLEQLEQNKQHIISLYDMLPNKKDVEIEYSMFQKYLEENDYIVVRKQQLCDKLSTNTFSLSVKTLHKNIQLLQSKQNNNITLPYETKDELLNILLPMKTQEKEYETYMILLKDYDDNIKLTKNKINNEKIKYKLHNTLQQLLFSRSSLSIKINLNQITIQTIEKDIISSRKYQEYISIKNEYIIKKEQITMLTTQYEKCLLQLTALNTLKNKILEAESLSISTIINTINIGAQTYLEFLFPENPIKIELLTFKETKKNIKPQINIQILYKDIEYEIGMLSGGELARVVLAYSLALNDMSHSPLLLLDESFSSLDADTTNLAITNIRNYIQKDKLVLCIVHQPLMGLFDHIVML